MKRVILVLGLLSFVFCGSAFCQETSKAQGMIIEKVSPYGLEETVTKITENVKDGGWVVSGVKDLAKSIQDKGGPQVLPVRLVELCKPEYAGKILQDDASRYASVMMPCTISVYTKSDGKTYVSYVNAAQVGQMFGGVVGEVMGGPVAKDQDKFLEFLK